MTPAEQNLWNDVAERNLSHDISLRGVRTPKALIDDEIRKFRNIKPDKQKELLQALNQAPSEVLNPLSPTTELPVSLPYEDPLSILPGVLKIDETFTTAFCTLSPPVPAVAACTTLSSWRTANPADIDQLMLECQQEILKVRASKKPLKLSKIFQKNRQLLYKFLVVLKHKFGLTKRFGSIFRNFNKLNKLSTCIIKKFCSALHTRNLVEHAWLCKPDITVDVNYANKAPILNVSLNKCSTNVAILDTGSTYFLVPYTVWQTLGLKRISSINPFILT